MSQSVSLKREAIAEDIRAALLIRAKLYQIGHLGGALLALGSFRHGSTMLCERTSFEVPDKAERMRRAQQFRERAEELRTIADGLKDHNSKETMLRIAIDYERLASRAETMSTAGDFPSDKIFKP